MKTNFTFDELSKAFSVIAKIENAARKQIDLEKEYKEKSSIFDAEFRKYGYTFFNAPEELQVMFDEKCALFDELKKAERKAYKIIKDFAALLGIGVNDEFAEDTIKEYIDRKLYFKVEKAVEYCKYFAKQASRRITY